MKIKESYKQFGKFVIVGLINTGVDWLIFFLLQFLNFFVLQRPLAKAISFIIAAVNSFFLNSYWTFNKEFKNSLAGSDKAKLSKGSIYFGRFFAVSLVGWVINTLVFTVAISVLPKLLPDRFINVGALTLASGAGIIWNFFANKYWTYNKINTATIEPKEKKKRLYFNLIGAILLAVVAFISFQLAKSDSAIVDEVAHIPAGYSYVKYLDYRLNPEHPPLAKALSGIPLSFMNLNGVDQSKYWAGIDQWDSGWDFMYKLGNNADSLILMARLPMIMLLLILGVYLYRFAAELFGRKTAVVVLALFAFYPDLLAHGHLVTTDVAATLGFILAVYYFYHWQKNKSKSNLIYAGIAFGLAQLLKFSAVLLYPTFIVYIVYLSYMAKKVDGKFWKSFWANLLKTIYIWLIGFVLIYLVYLVLCWNTPSGVEHSLIESNLTNDSRTLIFRNLLHHFEGNPFLRAFGHYVLGIFLVFGRVGGGNNTYILGHFSDKSISWFFPVAYLIKTPLPVIILFVSGLVSLVWRRGKDGWLKILLLTPVIIYWAVTLKGSLNIGIRHLMPTIPFVLLFIGYFIHKYLIEPKLTWRSFIIYALTIWMIVGTLANYPKYMSYFNELTTGKQRYNLMVDSSLDWGQDLKRLRDWVNENNVNQIFVDYFGGGLPQYYLPHSVTWRSGYGPTSGYIAVSATYFQFSKMAGRNEGKWSYEWLEDYKPVTIIGDSILVYHITPQDLIKNPPKSPYPITAYDKQPASSTAPSTNN